MPAADHLQLARFGQRGKAALLRGRLLALSSDIDVGLDAREDHAEVDRLGHIIVRALLQRLDDRVVAGLGGRHDDRQVGHRPRLAHLLEHLDTVEPRHHDVEQDQIEVLGLDHLERLVAVAGHRHLVALAPKAPGQNVAVHLLIVDDENMSIKLFHWKNASLELCTDN